MPSFEYETLLDCPVETAFDFLSRPANVARVSSPTLGLKLVHAPEVVSVGSSIEFQIASFGQVHQIVYKIVTVQRHELIVEEQIKGPMKAWKQEHLFESRGSGARLVDRVEFVLPGGLLGMLLSEDKIVDQLEDGFFHRQRELEKLVQTGGLT